VQRLEVLSHIYIYDALLHYHFGRSLIINYILMRILVVVVVPVLDTHTVP